MSEIKFLCFDKVIPEDLIAVVNEDSLRKHLIDHPYFDTTSIRSWMEDKIKTDTIKGCRIRAVIINGVLAGWCGIQPDNNRFELAIVISKRFWGFGIPIFKTLMNWAEELGHKEVLFHLLDSRPEYKFLKDIATNVHKTKLLGRCFTTYHLAVKSCAQSQTKDI